MNASKGSSDKTLTYTYLLLSGMATAALTLLLVYWANVYGHFNIMGWHLDYIIPAGAMLVGIMAGSGYGLFCWISGIKIPRGLLWAIILLQCVAYVAAEYIAFEQLHLV